ncbi:hypothetical protein E1A91_A12G145500v1 [Gossypium mustelinum]|uniref:GAG-pre-integrase domain-containing protein n=1 Tax=Gossypium mustelinum TaxID=34275 RepID=A0A5D2WVW0_GOSMU|nr:hypothetical protein E1A91_A12G145500v1 [Gossypium mustelinum]
MNSHRWWRLKEELFLVRFMALVKIVFLVKIIMVVKIVLCLLLLNRILEWILWLHVGRMLSMCHLGQIVLGQVLVCIMRIMVVILGLLLWGCVLVMVTRAMNGHARGPIGAGHDFGQNDFVHPQLDGGHYSSRPNANCVHLGPRVLPTAPKVLWQTKPRARVFDVDSSQYDSSQFVGISPWCLTYVLLTILMPLPMVQILIPLISMFHCRLEARRSVRILELLIMCVKMPPIFIHPLHIQTQEILLRGQVRDGLYHFSAESVALCPSAYNAAVQDCSTGVEVFTLWHKSLGHPSSVIVKTVLD